MAKGSPEAAAAVSSALAAIEPGVAETETPMEPSHGSPVPMSMEDLLKDIQLSPEDLGLQPEEGDKPEVKPEPQAGDQKPPTGTTEAKTGQAEGDDAPEVPDIEELKTKAQFAEAFMEEWQEDKAAVAANFFSQLNPEEQRKFIQEITGEDPVQQKPRGRQQANELPENYETQSDMEDWLLDRVDDIRALPQVRQHIASVTEAVTNTGELFNFAAAHAHLVEAKVNAIAELLDLKFPDVDLKKAVDSAKKSDFKTATAKMTAEYKKVIESAKQANKKRPPDSTGEMNDLPVLKPNMSAVSILKILEGGS